MIIKQSHSVAEITVSVNKKWKWDIVFAEADPGQACAMFSGTARVLLYFSLGVSVACQVAMLRRTAEFAESNDHSDSV